MKTASHQLRPHIPALDGLRGIACIMVVFYHNFPFLYRYLFFAWLSMDIFFVLSGYLITDILCKTFVRKNYLRNFYARRLLRVFPLYYLAIFLFLVLIPSLVRMPFRIDYFTSNQIYFWLFLQNWLLIFNKTDQSFLNHLWSMAVEEQFYLLWPLVFAFIRKPKILITLLIILLLSFVTLRFWLWNSQLSSLPYFSFYSFTRIDGICIGCLIGLLQNTNTKFVEKYTAFIVLFFAAVNFIFYFVNKQVGHSIPYLLVGYSTFSMLFGLLLYDLINHENSWFTKFFNLRLLRFVGTISYGTYIFHWPVFLLLSHYLAKLPNLNSWVYNVQVFSSVVATIIAFIIGYLSYRYFEMKFLKLKRYFN